MSFWCLSLLQPSLLARILAVGLYGYSVLFSVFFPPFFINASPLMCPVDTVDCTVAVDLLEKEQVTQDISGKNGDYSLSSSLIPLCQHCLQSPAPTYISPKQPSSSQGFSHFLKVPGAHIVPPASVISLGLILGRKPASDAF